MAALTKKVEVMDAEGRVIATEWAYGNTQETVSAAAESLARQLRCEHSDSLGFLVTVRLGRAVKG